MKTNVVMQSQGSRELYGVVIRQETKDSFLSLTDLQEAYLHARVENGWSDRGSISSLLNLKENSERIYYLLKEQDFIKVDIFTFMKDVEENGIIKTLKALNVYKTTGRGENKQVFCNPYIWVLVAMELNPQLYAKVIIWLTDKLIPNRIDACDLNKDLRSVLCRNIENPDYREINRALNIKIFGYHQTGMRNLASEEELKKLNTLQENIAFCIERGYLKNNEEIIEEIKK